MTYLTKEDILQAQDIVTEDVAVPQWGGTVRVRGLSGVERDIFEASLFKGKGAKREIDPANIRAKLVAQCIVDADGKRVFSDSDIVALGKKSAAALTAVFAVAQRLSGVTDEDVNDLEANLDSTASGDS